MEISAYIKSGKVESPYFPFIAQLASSLTPSLVAGRGNDGLSLSLKDRGKAHTLQTTGYMRAGDTALRAYTRAGKGPQGLSITTQGQARVRVGTETHARTSFRAHALPCPYISFGIAKRPTPTPGV